MKQFDPILAEANEVISGARAFDYGTAEIGFKATAEMWTAYLTRRLNEPLVAEDVAMMAILLKVSREANSHKRDNLVDIAGYAALAERVRK